MTLNRWKGLCLLVLMTLSFGIFGQENLLERKITIAKQTTSVGAALKLIEQLTPCTFSYAGGVVHKEQVVLISAKNSNVRDVLYQMFGPTVQCTQRKNIIILTKTRANAITASGYVQNKQGEPIANATVYDPVNLRTARTNAHGYYEIRLRSDSIPPLVVSKSRHLDTLIVPIQTKAMLQYITLEQQDTTWHGRLMEWPDSIKTGFWKVAQRTQSRIDNITEIRNVRDSLERSGQISLVPLLGTNGRLSGSVSNDWSFNLIGGINGAVNCAELGGVFNINRGNVRYFQTAGVFNLVQGNMRGFQSAGIANVVSSDVIGFQCAGVINVDRKDATGLIIGGIGNWNGTGFNGLTVGGIFNHAGDTSNGMQIAGIYNQAKHLNGIQIGGILNQAEKINGMQLGLINVADTLKGVALGFLSIVKSGYQQLAIHYDELDYVGLQWRTGTHFFYNIIDVAVRLSPVNHKSHFSYGYGLGISTNNRKPWVWNNDFTAHHFVPGVWKKHQEYVGRYYSGVEKRWGRIWALSLGVTANIHAYELAHQQLALPLANQDIRWKEENRDGYSYKIWFGWRVGMRFNLNPKPRRS